MEHSPEREFTVPTQFEFMSEDAIDAFRAQQDEQLFEAGREAVQAAEPFQGAAAREAARDEIKNQNDANCEAYVAEHMDRDDNPRLFDAFKQLAIKYSVHNMGSEAWQLGDTDEDGNHTKSETSGRDRLKSDLADLLDQNNNDSHEHDHGHDDDDDENDDESQRPLTELEITPELRRLHGELKTARDELAKLSVERRRKYHRIGRKKAEQKFIDATEAYEQANLATSVGYINQLREQGFDPEQLHAQALEQVIKELGAFTAAQKEAMQNDTTHRGRLAVWLGEKNSRLFATSIVGGVAAGIGLRAGARAALGTTSGILGGVWLGAAVGATIGAASSLVSNRAHLYSQLENRGEKDVDTLTKDLQDAGHEDDVQDTFTSFYGKLKEIIQTRERKDQSLNRRRMAAATVLGGAAGAGGALLFGAAVDHNWLGLGGHESAGTGHASGAGHHGHHHPGHTDGFRNRVYVEHGHGYSDELQDLAAQKHLNLSDQLAWHDYTKMAHHFHGDMFTNNPSYTDAAHPAVHGTKDFLISRPGYSTWGHDQIHFFNRMLEQQIKAGKVTTA